MNEKETKEIPTWQLEELSDTFRIISNVLNCKERVTSMDRMIMRAWNHVCDLMNGHLPSSKENYTYYLQAGQEPSPHGGDKENAGDKVNTEDEENDDNPFRIKAIPISCGTDKDGFIYGCGCINMHGKAYLATFDREFVEVKPDTIQQYIREKDSRGRSIYTKDMVEISGMSHYFQVYMDKNSVKLEDVCNGLVYSFEMFKLLKITIID